MAKKVAIRERRFRLVLWLADDKLEKRVKELCELAEVSINFALNSIPVANIVPLLGKWVNTAKEKHADLDIVLNLTKKRAPVIITAQVAQTFSSNSNKSDKQYWDATTKGAPDAFGIYKSKYQEIFKGYLQPPTTEVTAVSAGLSIPVVHWLADLAEISLFTTAMHLGTPMEMSLQMYHLMNRNCSWCLTENLKIDNDMGAVWENGIKKLFLTLLEKTDQDKNNKQFKFIQEKRERAKRAIERIKPDKTLKLGRQVGQWKRGLSAAISKCLRREDYRQFTNVSAWDRLVGSYSPQFLFSIIPAVNEARLIPTPTVVYKDEAIEITNSEIFRVRSAPVTANQISRIICIPSKPVDYTGNLNGNPRYHDVGHYPEDKDMKDRSGYVHVVAWPTWITESIPVIQNKVPFQPRIVPNPKKLIEGVAKAMANALLDAGAKEVQKKIGEAYAQYAYLIAAFNTTSAVIVTPIRPDISPGAMVKFHTKLFGDNDSVFYGTVSSMQFHFTAGESPCTTTLSLTNIRDSKTVDSEIDNPQKDVGFYERQWTGKQTDDRA